MEVSNKDGIRLRSLVEKDAPFMLEWMHDPDVQKGFQKNMLSMTIQDAEKFCRDAKISKHIENGDSIHYAITDDSGEYLGTISLKNIDLSNKCAEYAIILRKKAQDKGIACKATDEILYKAFNEFGLHRVFLSVLANNEAAVRLYEKCGFIYEGEFREHLRIGDVYMNWKWYSILETEYNERL